MEVVVLAINYSAIPFQQISVAPVVVCRLAVWVVWGNPDG
jgi:hypothetical protein